MLDTQNQSFDDNFKILKETRESDTQTTAIIVERKTNCDFVAKELNLEQLSDADVHAVL